MPSYTFNKKIKQELLFKEIATRGIKAPVYAVNRSNNVIELMYPTQLTPIQTRQLQNVIDSVSSSDETDTVVVHDNFLGNTSGNFQANTSNGGTVSSVPSSVEDTESVLGIWSLKVSNSFSSRAGISFGSACVNLSDHAYTECTFRIKLATLSAGPSDAFSVSVGFIGSGTTHNASNMAVFRYDQHSSSGVPGMQNAGNWACVHRNSGVWTVQDSGIPASTSEYRYFTVRHSALAGLQFMVDYETVFAVTSGIAGTTNATALNCGVLVARHSTHQTSPEVRVDTFEMVRKK